MRLFDRTGAFTFTIVDKKVTLRYPSDAQWADRARKHPTTRQVSGDEMISAAMDTGAFDMQLAKACWVDKFIKADGTEIVSAEIPDAATAKRLINYLDRITVDDDTSTVDGGGVVIHALVVGGKACTYRFKMPTQGSLDTYLGAASVSSARLRKRELKQTTVLEPGGELFDRNIVSVEGYEKGADGVPLNHKAAIAAVLADLADAKLEPELVDDPLD